MWGNICPLKFILLKDIINKDEYLEKLKCEEDNCAWYVCIYRTGRYECMCAIKQLAEKL